MFYVPPIICTTHERQINSTPNIAHLVVTIFQSKRMMKNELAPQKTKNKVISHLWFPNAYSLIIRQLGSNSGLIKCNINKHSSEIAAHAIVSFAKFILLVELFTLLNFIYLKQCFQLIKTNRDALFKA